MKNRGRKLLVLLTGALLLVSLAGVPAAKADTDGESGYIPLAADKGTPYAVVSYLESSGPIQDFLVNLQIKTRAAFPLCDEAEGPAIYIGTAEQLRQRLGADAAPVYTQYAFLTVGDDIYICLAEEDENMAKKILSSFEDSIVKTGDGQYGVDKAAMGLHDVVAIGEQIPVFETAAGQKNEVHDCGSGNYMIRYSGLDARAPQEAAAYEAALRQAGYTLHQENAIGENRFSTWYKGDTQIHCNYFAALGEFRIVYGPKGYLFNTEPVTDYDRAVTPSVSIIKGTDNVMCMAVQLADGSFIVIDGGWDKSTYLSKTLNAGEENQMEVSYFRDVEADMQTLYDFLKANTPGEGKPQITWMITHADPDHIRLPSRFIKDYRDLIDVNMAIYNFPSMYNIGLGESAGSTNDPLVMTTYAESFIKAVRKYFPDAAHYVYHTGEKMYLPGGDVEFLFTPEDFYPNPMPWMNHTCGTWRFTLEGTRIMIPGDAEVGLCGQMVAVFGDYLKSDVLQTNHHGSNGATLEFYRHIDPTVCFWTCQQYHLDHDSRHLGLHPKYDFNAFLRNSEKVIAHYSNSETHTVLLPSLEEKPQIAD